MEKILVGLSGGVDSAVAAYLLKKQGYDVIGVTISAWRENETDYRVFEKEIADARSVADVLGIHFQTLDCRSLFYNGVVLPFCRSYLSGKTPNPCILCNRVMKWGALLSPADSLGIEKIATGHYASVKKLNNGRFSILPSLHGEKDQSYALSLLSQEALRRTVFPLADLDKNEVRKIAGSLRLPIFEKPDSEEICFIPDKNYGGFLKRMAGPDVPALKPGNFISADGTVLGQHKGFGNYTLGQRKGLNIAMGHPVYVTKLLPPSNEVVLGENEDLFTEEFDISDVNFMGAADLTAPISGIGKIRYLHKGAPCTVSPSETGGTLHVQFGEKVRAITPGQQFVLYSEDRFILLSGTIR